MRREAAAGDRHQRAAGQRASTRAHARDHRGIAEGSAGDVVDVPLGVVTVTLTVPLPAGLSTVIFVSLTTVKLVAGIVPKSTPAAAVKPLPVIVTNVPPASDRPLGLKPVTAGTIAE